MLFSTFGAFSYEFTPPQKVRFPRALILSDGGYTLLNGVVVWPEDK